MRTPLALFENLLYDLTLFVSMFTSHDLHYDVSKSTVGDRQGTRVQEVPVAKNGVKNTTYNEKAWLRIIDRYWTNVILSDGIVVSELSFLLLSCFGILIIDWYLN